MNTNEEHTQQTNDKPKKSKNVIVKVLAIIGGIVVAFILLIVIIISIVSINSNKLVCKSSQGNITIMYNDSTISGYVTTGMNYDMAQQKAIANQIGINEYISEFKTWFESNTNGTCTTNKK